MINSMKQRYEELKKYGNILLNYNDILLFYPDYYKTKIELQNEKFITKEDADKIFEEKYESSKIFKLLSNKTSKEQAYEYLVHNKDVNYECLKSIFDKAIESSITMCELIDYIGHYPSTYPVPKEEEKNLKMEELLEEYDIVIRYYLDDEIDEMQIISDDVVRIIEKLNQNLELIDEIKKVLRINNWLIAVKYSEEETKEQTKYIINEINSFPLSKYQEKNKSKREEAKMYLRLQHGNII